MINVLVERPITNIIIHCSATENGKMLSEFGKHTAAELIDSWHKARGFHRSVGMARKFNTHLKHIGYQYVIDADGFVETGRGIGEIGAHTKGFNTGSIGICLVGGLENGKGTINSGKYSDLQWLSLTKLILEIKEKFPQATVKGHRDFSPDLNGDGTITPNEFIKSCPCFDVQKWLDVGDSINYEHLLEDFKE